MLIQLMIWRIQMSNNDEMTLKYGYLASRVGIFLPLQVLATDEGFYIGTWQNGPYSRESKECFADWNTAQAALNTNQWTQLEHP